MEFHIIDDNDTTTGGNRNTLDDTNVLHIANNNESQNFTEAKLFLSVKSLEYIPFPQYVVNKHLRFIKFKYVCDIEIMNDYISFHLFNSNLGKAKKNESNCSITNKEIFSPIQTKKNFYSWDIGHYYGEIKVKITVKRVVNFLKCKILGIKIMKLSDFLCKQNENKSNHYWSTDFKIPLLIPFDFKKLDVLNKDNNNSHSNFNNVPTSWLFNKTAAYATGLSPSTQLSNNFVTNNEDIFTLNNSLQDKIMLKLIDFNTHENVSQCSVDNINNTNSYTHKVNELHLLIATAPSEVIVAMLKQLTMKNVLMKCLLTRTSNSFTPFDIALLNGRGNVVKEMLSRCGDICFQNIATNTSSPIHNAVIGGSVLCVEYLIAFLGRYCTRETPSIVESDSWLSNLQVQLEWLDEHGNTALSLACMLPSRYSITKLLLSKKANPCSINPITKSTPLLNACQLGDVEIVRLLFHSTKSRMEVLKNIYGLDSLNEIRKSALYKHIQINLMSRNLLLGSDRSNGGYFNILSMYLCNPKHCDIYGRQAIHIAAEYSHNEVFMIILRLYINSNSKYDCVDTTDLAGNNLFHILAKHGNIELIKKVIEIETDYWIHVNNNNNNSNNKTTFSRRMHLLVRNSNGKLPVDLCLESGYVLLSLTLMQEIIKLYNLVAFKQLDTFLIQHLIYIQQLLISKVTTITATTTNSSYCYRCCQEQSSTQLNNNKQSCCCCCTNEKMTDDTDINKVCLDILSTLHQLKFDNHNSNNNNLPSTNTTTIVKGDIEDTDVFIDDFADAFEYSLALSPLALSKFK